MQVKFTRSAKKGGMLGGKVIYQLTAHLQPTEEENRLITAYKRWDSGVWRLANTEDPDMMSLLTNVTLEKLRAGTTIEHENFNRLLAAEDAIVEACQSVIRTCEVLDTFNGSERVVEVTGVKSAVVAAA